MSDDSNNIEFSLDLDAKDFTETMGSIKEALDKLGESGSFDKLVEGMTGVMTEVAIITVAFAVLKETFDAVFDAEKIKAVNAQFEILGTNAGLATDELRKGLVDAAGGFVAETELIQGANQAIVKMGASAAQLPALMELARKSSLVMGTDVMTTFNNLAQAVASGSQRLLKQQGIMLDTTKVYKDYANSIGVAVDSLSEAGKQQAMMNAVIEKGGQSFAGIDTNVQTATNSWKQLKVSIAEMGDTAVLAFDRLAGPSVRAFLGNVAESVKYLGLVLKSEIGTGAEAAGAQMELLEKKIATTKQRIDEATKSQNEWSAAFGGGASKEEVTDLTNELKGYETELGKVKKAQTDSANYGPPLPPKGAAAPEETTSVDQDKKRALTAKFEQEMLKLREQRIDQQLKLSQSETETDALLDQKKVTTAQEMEAKIKSIRESAALDSSQKAQMEVVERQQAQAKIMQIEEERNKKHLELVQERINAADSEDKYEELYAEKKKLLDAQYEQEKAQLIQNELLNQEQKNQALEQMQAQHEAKMSQMQAQSMAEQNKVIDNYVNHSTGAADAFARGFASASMKAKNSLTNFGAQGAAVSGMLTSHMSTAFMEMGEGSKKGSAIMKEAMLGMIGDIAQYYGTMMLAAGIFPPNPAALAGGAALLVLAGYLKSKSGGGMTSSGGGSIGGGSADLGAPAMQATDTSSSMAQQNQQQQKNVSLVVQGNYFDTDQTRTRLTELVRESLDSTDFSVRKIGS